MTRLSIEIPDELTARLQERAVQCGHDTVGAYIEALVREDVRMIEYSAPDNLRVRSREQLVAMLLEALDTPAREMTTSDWRQMRQELIQRHGRAKAG